MLISDVKLRHSNLYAGSRANGRDTVHKWVL